jgi:hypothetical protein
VQVQLVVLVWQAAHQLAAIQVALRIWVVRRRALSKPSQMKIARTQNTPAM